MRTALLILAAGYSSRMGQAKALTCFQGKTFLEHILEKIPVPPHPSTLGVVLGESAQKIQKAHPQFAGKWILNPAFSEGKNRSLQVGLSVLDPTISGVWMWPIDFPFIQKQSIEQLFSCAQETPEKVVVPSYHFQRGHPVYIPANLFPEIHQLRKSEILRTILFREPLKIHYCILEDQAVLWNINTPADLFARDTALAFVKGKINEKE
jgi:molybdenum cofactor cytidylyltransferase